MLRPALALVASFLAAACGLASPPAQAEPLKRPLRVDLGMNTGRSDTAAPGWTEWQVPDGPEATRDFDGIRVTLRGAGQGDAKLPLHGVWNKRLLLTARMAADGVIADRGGIEIQIDGLTDGPHSFVTYHSVASGPESKPLRIAVDGLRLVPNLQPTHEAADDADVAGGYVEFTASDGQPVIVAVTSASDADVILNGFEIDASNPAKKAKKPQPADLDWHVDADQPRLQFSWQAVPGAKEYRIYFGGNEDEGTADGLLVDRHEPVHIMIPKELQDPRTAPQELELALEDVEFGPMDFVTVKPKDPKATRVTHEVPPDVFKSSHHSRWCVDAIDASGKVTKGDVWSFRTRHLAFPGAEGHGRFAIGGRGGRVVKVTNLNDSGPGSLRAAVELDEPRTVVFDVSGRIVLQSTLGIRNPYLTIAGQTAPGKGICLANYNMGMMGSHDVIIRYMRVRPGNTSGETLDGMGMASSDHSIFDHCSISWTQDESFSSRGAGNITLQRTLISEALNVAGHRKYEKGKQHGYAASIGGDIGSFHHNLLAHCSGRNWSLAGGLNQATRHAGRLDIRNNVVYNWGHRTTDGGAAEVNFVNNYYKPGPASDVFHVLMAEREAVDAFGPQMYYVDGNVMEGRFSAGDKLAGVFERRGESHAAWIVEKPFYESYVTTESAEDAYESVLADVGCNVPALDEHDQRVLAEVRDGTTTYKGSVSGLPGLPDTQDDVGGWDDYPEEHRAADYDADNDGMPSAWEKEHGLDPANPADAAQDSNQDGYTNLEDYLNSIVR